MWWTPGTPDQRVPGTLTRVEDGWRLDLIGALSTDPSGEDSLHLVPPQTIWGACRGVLYTLMECYLRDVLNSRGTGVPEDVSDQWLTTWRVESVVRGGTVTEATPFRSASFEITGLPAWWPPSGLRGPQARSGAYEQPDDVSVPLQDGEITIGVRGMPRHGRRVRSLRERVVVWVEKSTGFTLEDLAKDTVEPLRALVAIGVDEPVSVFNLRVNPLSPDPDGRPSRSFEVDPQDSAEPEELPSTLPAPLPLSPALPDVPSFIPAWLEVARRCSVPLDAVEPRQRSGSLQLQFLDVVNAAETLHRSLHAEPAEYPFAERVREALKDFGGFSAEERRTVRDAVKFTETSLENRLLALAEVLGSEVCDWLFDGNVRPWAYVTARLRNVLSHWFAAPDGVHEDPGALVGALRLTEAVITLRLFLEAGLPSGTSLVSQLERHRGLRSLSKQSIADWPLLAHRINSRQWPQPHSEHEQSDGEEEDIKP
ncbi:HEPN domain-containing protein [Streptomyces sp. V4I2]|uniref:ApeA N-terminal domain 1-containing protein n=1 Tax=Streptomyces sp. V4I2 TaxID=3042280 RepID=UPI0027D85C93|nr:HEPN domain-containing protein [Streptomyces sp. V4I2]